MSKLTSSEVQTLFGALHSATYKSIDDGYYATANQDINLLADLVPMLDIELRASYTDFVGDVMRCLDQARMISESRKAIGKGA